jgi:hypothetical protein
LEGVKPDVTCYSDRKDCYSTVREDNIKNNDPGVAEAEKKRKEEEAARERADRAAAERAEKEKERKQEEAERARKAAEESRKRAEETKRQADIKAQNEYFRRNEMRAENEPENDGTAIVTIDPNANLYRQSIIDRCVKEEVEEEVAKESGFHYAQDMEEEIQETEFQKRQQLEAMIRANITTLPQHEIKEIMKQETNSRRQRELMERLQQESIITFNREEMPDYSGMSDEAFKQMLLNQIRDRYPAHFADEEFEIDIDLNDFDWPPGAGGTWSPAIEPSPNNPGGTWVAPVPSDPELFNPIPGARP